MQITLGSKIRDRISGVKGIVLGRTEYLYQSPRLMMGIQECDTNGRPNEPIWLDEAQCECIEEGNGRALGFQPPSRS